MYRCHVIKSMSSFVAQQLAIVTRNTTFYCLSIKADMYLFFVVYNVLKAFMICAVNVFFLCKEKTIKT